MGDRSLRRGVRPILVLGVVAAVLALAVVLAQTGRTSLHSSEPPPSNVAAAGEPGHFERDGFAFDYPASWHFYPMEMSASFFSTVGYLASAPIDVDRICIRTPNSLSCDFRNYGLVPGQIVLEIAMWGVPTDPQEIWDRPAKGRRIQVADVPALFSQEVGPDRTLEGFRCFPGNGTSVVAKVTAAPGAPLRKPLMATCSTRITATDLGWWRMELVVAWDGISGGELDQRYTTIQWVAGDGALSMQSSGGDNLPNCCRG